MPKAHTMPQNVYYDDITGFYAPSGAMVYQKLRCDDHSKNFLMCVLFVIDSNK